MGFGEPRICHGEEMGKKEKGIIYQDREGISARKQLYEDLVVGKCMLALENGENFGMVGVPDEGRKGGCGGGLIRVGLHII